MGNTSTWRTQSWYLVIWLLSYNSIDQKEISKMNCFPSMTTLKLYQTSVQGQTPCFLFWLWNVRNLIYLRAVVEESSVPRTCSTLSLLSLSKILLRLFRYFLVNHWPGKSPHFNSSSGLMHLNDRSLLTKMDRVFIWYFFIIWIFNEMFHLFIRLHYLDSFLRDSEFSPPKSAFQNEYVIAGH